MRKQPKELPPLCVAVKRLREAFGDSQDRFARRLDVAVMTVSKFETGRAEPRDPRVLLNLASLAYEKTRRGGDMNAEETLFREAYKDIERIKNADRQVNELFYDPRPPSYRSMREWRLACAARLALLHFPQVVSAAEEVLSPALALVDEVLRQADENQIDYQLLEREVFARAERHALQELKGRSK